MSQAIRKLKGVEILTTYKSEMNLGLLDLDISILVLCIPGLFDCSALKNPLEAGRPPLNLNVNTCGRRMLVPRSQPVYPRIWSVALLGGTRAPHGATSGPTSPLPSPQLANLRAQAFLHITRGTLPPLPQPTLILRSTNMNSNEKVGT